MIKNKKWVVFTKLDNDDSLSKTWIDEIQKFWVPITSVLGRPFSFVNFNNGLLYIKRNDEDYLLDHKDRHNPFVNSIEKVSLVDRGGYKTCWKDTHNRILGHIYPNYVLRMEDSNTPMFLINDQKFNLCNRDNKIESSKKTKKDYNYIKDNFGINIRE